MWVVKSLIKERRAHLDVLGEVLLSHQALGLGCHSQRHWNARQPSHQSRLPMCPGRLDRCCPF